MENKVSCTLTITEGGSLQGQIFELAQNEMIIGRSADLAITIDNRVVSRQHARISFQDGHFFIEDLRSSNGTYLNGELLTRKMALNSGDHIGLGHQIILLFEDPQAQLSGTMDGTALSPDNLQTLMEGNLVEGTIVEGSFNDNPIIESPIEGTKISSTPEQSQIVLLVSIAGLNPTAHPLQGQTITIGRSEDNDIVIASPVISRHHARLERIGDGYQIQALEGATNALILAGQPILDLHRLQHGDIITIGSNLADVAVNLTYQTPVNLIQTSVSAQAVPTAGKAQAVKPDMTIVDMGIDSKLPSKPDTLTVTIAGQPSQSYKLVNDRITLGRAEDNDIVISSGIISRQHAYLERVPGGYDLVISADATNTLVCQGRPVTKRQHLQNGDVLRVDSEIPGMMVTMTYQSSTAAGAQGKIQTIDFGSKDKLTFGRDASNDVVLEMPNISRLHAQVERIGRRYAVTDMRSANGTFVNDQRIDGQVWLKPQDTIRIGQYRFVVGEDKFIRYDETSGLRVETLNVNKWVRKDLNILQDISLVFQPREFIVIVGQSGGGKSTLVDAITGYRPATQGSVFVNGIEVYKNFDAVRNEIGYVPQKDIIHMELTVYQALDYAARLRMPRDTSKSERHERIMEVLSELDLAHRKDNQISSLSGGQQKRVSIGVELLTRPGLFFLDEPTSGLDPGTETAFMHLCRRLADQGRTIVMVTHATKNVMLADKVVFLARGGYLAWFGPPNEALEYFNQYRSEREQRTRPMEFDQIYAILDDPSKGKASEWAERFINHQAYQQYISDPLKVRHASLPLVEKASKEKSKSRRSRKRSQISSLRQFAILSSRNVKILVRDRSSLVLMVLIAPLVGMLDLVIAPLMGRAPFDFYTGDAPNASITLFLLTIYCLLVGGLSQMREFVKETDIYRRERLVNLKIFPYVTSKVWVALLLAFYHAAAYTIIHFIAFDMPGSTMEFATFYVTTTLAVMAGMMGGLLASAISPAASSAPMIMILLIVPQIVLSGALAPVPTNVSAIASTRWALEGYIGITGIGSDIAADACWKLPEELRDAMTLDDKEYFQCRCLGTAIFKPGSCNFPGAGEYYSPEIDQDPSVNPPPLGEKPPEPVLPEAPEPPTDKNDQVAMVQYLNALSDYQNEAERIQNDYRSQMQVYEAQAKVYEVEMADYQEAITTYNVAREGATKGAEELMASASDQFGFGYVNKDDPEIFWPWLFGDWTAQGIIITVYFLVILYLIKRKDVI